MDPHDPPEITPAPSLPQDKRPKLGSTRSPLQDHATGTAPTRTTALTEADAKEIATFYHDAVPRIVKVLVQTTSATFEQASEAAHCSVIEAARGWGSINKNRIAWCVTVAKRHWATRRYSVDESFTDIPPSSPLLEDANENVYRRVEARMRLYEVVKKLPLLTPQERVVLDLHLAGLENATIADHCGCEPATVRVHLANLRKKLNDAHPSGPGALGGGPGA